MASEWTITKLADGPLEIVDGDRGWNYPKQHEFAPSGQCLFLNAGNVTTSGFNFSDCLFISAEKDAMLRKGKLQRHDIVLTTRGTVGNIAYYDESVPYDHIRINSGMVILRAQPQKLHPRFLYLFLRSSLFSSQVESLRTGSAQPQLPIRDINRIEICIPPLPEQRAIAHTLGTLDAKIELNRRMNETLEQMARAIFKSWFVDFDPVIDNALRAGNPIPSALAEKAARRRELLSRANAEGRDSCFPKHIADIFTDRFVDNELGPIPQGWRLAELGDIALIIDCLHSKKPERREKGFPLLQLWNIRDDGLIDMSDPFYIDESDYRMWISRIEASPGDCVITNVGRVAAVAQIPSGLKAALGRNMTGIRCKDTFPFPTFLIQSLLSEAMRNEIVRKIDTGTILDSLNVRNIPCLRVILAQLDLLKKFEESTRSLRAKMESNLAHSRTLSALRDALLPKLISGEIRVEDAEKFLKECWL
jgi:type I restriction enzyme S subunit